MLCLGGLPLSLSLSLSALYRIVVCHIRTTRQIGHSCVERRAGVARAACGKQSRATGKYGFWNGTGKEDENRGKEEIYSRMSGQEREERRIGTDQRRQRCARDEPYVEEGKPRPFAFVRPFADLWPDEISLPQVWTDDGRGRAADLEPR